MKRLLNIKYLIINLFKIFLLFEIFVLFVVCEIICFSESSLSDFFSNGRTSFFKDEASGTTNRIIVDGSILTEGGIKNVICNVIDEIANKRPNWHFLFLYGIEKNNPLKFKSKNVKTIYGNQLGAGRYDFLLMPLIFVRDVFDYATFKLFHDQITQLIFFSNVYFNKNCCDLLIDPDSVHAPNDYSVPRISFIHDMTEMVYVKNFEKSFILANKYNQELSVKYSNKIITVSENSKKDIMRFFGINNDSLIKVIPICLANRVKKTEISAINAQDLTKRTQTLNNFRLNSKRYLIYPSIVRPHKNHYNLIRAFICYCEENPSSNLKLVIVGRIPEKFYNSQKLLIETLSEQNITQDVESKIVFTNFVSDETLNILLSNALAMIFPSLYEGFGMPVIEGMAAGIPVACSNVTSLPEVAGDAALLFDPYKTEEIENAIVQLVNDQKLREELIDRGYKRAQHFSDKDAMIDEYIKIFEECMNEKNAKN